MGSNTSKIQEQSVFSTPKKLQLPEQLVITVNSEESGCNLDPRSPHVCRTPIEKSLDKITSSVNESFELLKITSSTTQQEFQNPSIRLKNKLIKDLQCNLNDPRSPSQFINRTPIVFDESECSASDAENSFVVSEQFSDLSSDIEKLENLDKSNVSEVISQQDPRSPSFGVQRTPLIFPETENLPSLSTEAIEIVLEPTSTQCKLNSQNNQVNLINTEKISRFDNTKMMIYEDNDSMFSTPKTCTAIPNQFSKRTPLSCVGNKSHLRSRSVENSNKPKRFKFPATSYDDYNVDNLKAVNNENVELEETLLFD